MSSSARRVQLGDELPNPPVNLVANLADPVQGLAMRIVKIPIDVPLSREVGTRVAAAHRHDDVGPLGVLVVERPGNSLAQIDADFPHHLDHLGVNALGGTRTGGPGAMCLADEALEHGSRHLGTPGVLDADEEHVHRVTREKGGTYCRSIRRPHRVVTKARMPSAAS